MKTYHWITSSKTCEKTWIFGSNFIIFFLKSEFKIYQKVHIFVNISETIFLQGADTDGEEPKIYYIK